jgi:hypothetical protein
MQLSEPRERHWAGTETLRKIIFNLPANVATLRLVDSSTQRSSFSTGSSLIVTKSLIIVDVGVAGGPGRGQRHTAATWQP